jgi:hypothetical protein
VAVGQCADERLGEAEDEIADCDGEAERAAADTQLHAHRRQEQAERLADTHCQSDDQGGARDDDPGALHARSSSMRSSEANSRS